MDDVSRQIDQLLYQLFQEGLINDQFQQLMQLQDDSNPSFIKVPRPRQPRSFLPGKTKTKNETAEAVVPRIPTP